MIKKNLVRYLMLCVAVAVCVTAASAQKTIRSFKSETGVSKSSKLIQTGTTVSIVNTTTSPGLQVDVPVQADATGVENSFIFSVAYDSSVVSNPTVALGADVPAGSLTLDTTTPGLLGIHVSLPAGQALNAGTNEIVKVTFDVSSTATVGDYPVTFGDTPMVRDIEDSSSVSVSGTYTDGVVSVLSVTAAGVTVTGMIHTPFGEPIRRQSVSLLSSEGPVQTVKTNMQGIFTFNDVLPGTYVIRIERSKYEFRHMTYLINVFDTLTGLDFTGYE